MKKLLALCACIAFASMSVTGAFAADDKPEKPAENPAEKKADRPLPIRGKVAEVDKTAKSIKIGEHTYLVTSTTRIDKAGKPPTPATLEDVKVGDMVMGSYRKAAGDKLELNLLRIGVKPPAPPAPPAPQQ